MTTDGPDAPSQTAGPPDAGGGAPRRPRPLWALLRRELALEFRTGETVLATLVFAGIVALIVSAGVAPALVAIHFPAGAGTDSADPAVADAALRLQAAMPGVRAALIWIALLFATTLGVGRAFARERESGGGMDMLLLLPTDWASIYAAKLVATVAVILPTHAATLGILAVLLGWSMTPAALAWFAVLVVGVTVGHVALGLLLGAMTAGLRARDVLFPVLLLPMLIPLYLAALAATTALLQGLVLPGAMDGVMQSVMMVAVFDFVYLPAGAVLFPILARDA